MDLVDVVPVLNLYDRSWPIRTLQPQLPPPKFVHYAPGPPGEARRGEAVDSMVCAGLHRVRRARAAQHPVAERAGEQLSRWSRTRSCSTG